MRRGRFSENLRIRNVLLDSGECRETCDPKGPIPGTPTKETVPRRSLVISVRIVHELWSPRNRWYTTERDARLIQGMGAYKPAELTISSQLWATSSWFSWEINRRNFELSPSK